MKQNIRALAAIMFCGVALASCSDKDNDDNSSIVNPDPATVETVDTPTQQRTYTLTIKATKGGDASLSKALSLATEGKTINASWSASDQVKVYDKSDVEIATLTAAQSDGKDTQLSGVFYEGKTPNVGDLLSLKFNAPNYDNQKGTLEYIANNCDYAVANNVTVTEVTEDGKVSASTAEFKNQQAIVKFTLSSEDIGNDATALKVNNITITIPPASATKEVFVAIPEAEAKNIHLTVYKGTDTYVLYKADANFADGKYYTVNVKNLVKATDLSSVKGDIVIPDGGILTGTLSGNYKISIAPSATVTLSNVTIEGENEDDYEWAGITCEGDATIILEGKNKVTGFSEYYPGIYIAKDHTLTIDGKGMLDVASGECGAGIGGGWQLSCGNITIKGGTITATGGEAGIGCGSSYTSCGDITINGGFVTAEGYCGIGGSCDGLCGNITISSGTVIAKGRNAGIGEYCGNITISGGSVTATGGSHAAGIGSGDSRECGIITISGGSVTATGGYGAAGIGNGANWTKSMSVKEGNIIIGESAEVIAKGGQYAEDIGNGGLEVD